MLGINKIKNPNTNEESYIYIYEKLGQKNLNKKNNNNKNEIKNKKIQKKKNTKSNYYKIKNKIIKK